MNMVRHSIDPIKVALVVFDDTRDVSVQFFTMFFLNCAFAIFCTKNDLIKDLTITAHEFRV